MNIKEMKEKTAILILAYADYESLEMALASHAKYSINSGMHIYILQNGRGTYDTEKAYSIAKRYHSLFPRQIDVVDWIKPDVPYKSIRKLLNSDEFQKYEYIIKLDDDVMVLTEDWVDKLFDCYEYAYDKCGEDLAYVTSLVNNNPYGFKVIIDRNKDLADEYFGHIAREHFVGNDESDSSNPYRIIGADEIYEGGNGTIWQLPHVARWLHEKTTFKPEYYKDMVKGWGIDEVDARKRYSINCLLFKKDLWNAIDDGGIDDEGMFHEYCMLNGKRVFANLEAPMIHIAFYSQREFNRDMLSDIRDIYEKYFELNYPISVCRDKLLDIENRLRFNTGDADNYYAKFNIVVNSNAYKIGRTITYVPRTLKKIVRRIKK